MVRRHSQQLDDIAKASKADETERKLAFADCAQIPLHFGVETPPDVLKIEKIKTIPIDYAAVARKLQEIQPYLKEWVGY